MENCCIFLFLYLTACLFIIDIDGIIGIVIVTVIGGLIVP